MSKTYSNNGFTVTIEDNGSISVKPGDMISGYSMAIHGDFKHFHEYARKNGHRLVPVENVDLIYSGETLYHLPSVPPSIPDAGQPLPDPILPKKRDGSYDVAKIIRDQRLPQSYYNPLTVILNTGRFAQASITMAATVFEVIALAPALGFAAGVAGPILAVISGILAMQKARNSGLVHTQMRGTIYGTVAWAFDHGHIPLPERIRRNVEDGHMPDDLWRYETVWREAMVLAHRKCDQLVRDNKATPEAVKIFFQAFGGPNEADSDKNVAARLMLDAADDVFSGFGSRPVDKQFFLSPYAWYPNDMVGRPGAWGGRPNYPKDVDARYPYV